MHLLGNHQKHQGFGWPVVFSLLGFLMLGSSFVASDVQAQGMTGYYYSGTGFDALQATRTDPSIDFPSWPEEAMPEGMSPTNFSVRWLGQLRPRYSESYELIVTTDDGMRLWVGERLLIDTWQGQGATEYRAPITLRTGLRYDVMIEYYQGGGGGRASFEWVSPSQVREVITDDRLIPVEVPTDGETTVKLYAGNPTTGERATDLGKFLITRWGGSLDEPLEVQLTVSGDAVAGQDYAPLPESVTIGARRTSVGINVSVLDDNVAEPTKEVSLALGLGAGYVVGNPSEATIAIEDDDGATGPGVNSIVGMLEHGGTSAGNLVAVAWRDAGLTDEVGRAVLVQPGIYSIAGLDAGDYFVSGFLDENRNGSHDGDELRMEAGPITLPPDALEIDFDFTPGCDAPNAPASCNEAMDAGADAGVIDGGTSVGDGGTMGVDTPSGETPTSGDSGSEGCQQVSGFPGGSPLLWLGLCLGWIVLRRRQTRRGC